MSGSHPQPVNPSALAWRRFSCGLPEGVDSVECALASGLRSFGQWRTCLDTANRQAERVNRHVHRRAAISKPDNVGWRSLGRLSGGTAMNAEAISRQLGVHVDVVRRTLKTFRERGWVSSLEAYSRDQPRTFTITNLGRAALERVHLESED